MSRVGIRPINLPSGVQVEVKPTEVIVSGQNGQQIIALPHGIEVSQKGEMLVVNRLSDSQQRRALHGTVRANLNNAITGVSANFQKRLELIGIGYRAAVEGNSLSLQVGYTHPVKMEIPQGISVKIEKNVIVVTGPDKQQLGQFCTDIRAIRKPEPYKGKGIRYQGEHVRMKQGKAVKSGA
jgi:large subunit ribosomal protein L6